MRQAGEGWTAPHGGEYWEGGPNDSHYSNGGGAAGAGAAGADGYADAAGSGYANGDAHANGFSEGFGDAYAYGAGEEGFDAEGAYAGGTVGYGAGAAAYDGGYGAFTGEHGYADPASYGNGFAAGSAARATADFAGRGGAPGNGHVVVAVEGPTVIAVKTRGKRSPRRAPGGAPGAGPAAPAAAPFTRKQLGAAAPAVLAMAFPAYSHAALREMLDLHAGDVPAALDMLAQLEAAPGAGGGGAPAEPGAGGQVRRTGCLPRAGRRGAGRRATQTASPCGLQPCILPCAGCPRAPQRSAPPAVLQGDALPMSGAAWGRSGAGSA